MKYEFILKENKKKIAHLKTNSLKDILREVERKFDKDLLSR